MSTWHLGNDVVDRSHHGSFGKGTDRRFLARVCAPEEEATVLSSPDPDLALWVHWAGKEAIFKSTCKVLGSQPPFHHALFRVSFSRDRLTHLTRSGAHTAAQELAGTGWYEGLRFRISVERRDRYVHAVSWVARESGTVPDLRAGCIESPEDTRGPASGFRERFSSLEWECVTHRASALTRVMARRALATELGTREEALEIRCGPGLPGRRVPSVWMGGRELPVDITLSHHGRFLSWVFLRGAKEAGTVADGSP